MTRSTLLFFASLALPYTAISQETATEPAPPVTDPAAPISPRARPPVPANERNERGTRPQGKGGRVEGKSDQATSEKPSESERAAGKGKGARPPQPPESATGPNRAEAEKRGNGKGTGKGKDGGNGDQQRRTAPEAPANPRMATPPATVQKPAQNPAPKPAQTPASNSAQKPAPKPAQNPAPKPAQNPASKPAQTPAANSAQKPAPKSAPNQPAAENKSAAGNNGPKRENVRPVRPPRPTAKRAPSQETTRALADRGKRDRRADAQQAAKIEDKDDANKLIYTILGGAGAGALAAKVATADRSGGAPRGYRPPVEEVGRTQQDRDRNVGGIVQRFQGHGPVAAAPPGYAPAGVYRDDRGYEVRQDRRAPKFYNGNRRVVRYASANEVPPVIVASRQLNRVEMMPASRSPYAYAPTPRDSGDNRYYNEVPASYSGANAYAVSYEVDPNSAVSRDDILFRQGSTDFADAYSYDLVIDLAEAMNADALRNETFVIEGHASSEGDYGRNLLLSQERAERIARDLVYYGVDPTRVMPVGYGEGEAAYPAEAPDEFRSLDRRVVVFRMR